MQRKNLEIGSKFGHLTILENVYEKNKPGKVRVQCKCGKEYIAAKYGVKSGAIKQCVNCRRISSGLKRRKGVGKLSGYYWRSIILNAKDRNIPVEMSIEEAHGLFQKQRGKCVLSGVEIALDNYIRNAGTASLDRIDSNGTYSIDNVQWVHKDINFMKQSLTKERFIELCKAVSNMN